MSPQPSWSVARAELERVAQDLRAKGYEVFVEPSASEIPDFVREYQPDILARGATESLIVEVKQPLSESERERIRTIARRVEGHPGWRFMLVAPERTAGGSESLGVKPIEKQQLLDWLREARALVQSGHSRSALLVAWAGLEAAMRVAVSAHSLSEQADSWKLMRELVSNGLLDRESYLELTDLFRLRSALAHGMQPETIPASIDLDKGVEFMCKLAEQLISESLNVSKQAPA